VRLLVQTIVFGCLAALPARAQTVLFSDGFENGMSNWGTTGLWHLVDTSDTCGALAAPFPEATHCVYYGIAGTCDFDTGGTNSGALTLLTPIALPAAGPAVSLHCWTRQQTENCNAAGWDNFDIEVSTNGATWTVVAHRCDFMMTLTPETWQPRNVDLSAFLGQSIQIRFRFDAVDGWGNNYLGVLVDRVEIRVEAGHPFCVSGCPCAGQPSWYYNPEISFGAWSGCMHSQGHEGELSGSGTPSVANDSLVLTASGLRTPSAVMLLQSTTHNDGTFNGDGRYCLTGSSVRLGVQLAPTGSVSFPAPAAPPLSIQGSIPPAGATRHYQVVYRDPATWCTPAGLNQTNGYTITWTP